MYYITGQVKKLNQDFAVVDANGIGYHVRLTKRLAKSLSLDERSEILVVQVNVHHKEPIVYGFASPKERCMFSLLVEESMLPLEKAFGIVSEGGDDLARMIKDLAYDELEGLGLNEDQARLICARMRYFPFDIHQKEILGSIPPRKIVPLSEGRSPAEDELEVAHRATEASMEMIERVTKGLCALRQIKRSQAEPFIKRALEEVETDEEAVVLQKANALAKEENL